MQIAMVTFERFNEIGSFPALSILNRMVDPGVKAQLTAPTESVISMHGVRVLAQSFQHQGRMATAGGCLAA